MKAMTGIGTEREYHLTCRILVLKKSFEDFQSKGTFQNENFFVYLIPVLNSEGNAFFDAWLPVENSEQVEIPMEIKHPFDTNARGCVRRATAEVPFHHIHLMSYGLVQLIADKRRELHGREIMVKVLDEYSDSAADLTVKGELPFEQKKYSTSEIESDDDSSHLGQAVGETVFNGTRQKVYEEKAAPPIVAD